MNLHTVTASDDTTMTVINFHDWDGTRSASLEVPSSASVAEIVEEARAELDLAADVDYLALHRDRQLDGGITLRDSGVEADSDIDLVPNAKAG